jgi:hypothetical protein
MTSNILDAHTGDSVATEFLDALARQEWAAVQSLLARGVSLRCERQAMTPAREPGWRTGSGTPMSSPRFGRRSRRCTTGPA